MKNEPLTGNLISLLKSAHAYEGMIIGGGISLGALRVAEILGGRLGLWTLGLIILVVSLQSLRKIK